MKESFRQAMAWLHTWGGLVFTWLLFAIFFGGTLSFYRDEISLWMQPELHALPAPAADDAAVAGAVKLALAELQRRAPAAASWQIVLPSPRDPALTLRWNEPGVRFDRNAVAKLDPRSGAVLAPRQTQGGQFFRTFHYSLLAGSLGIWIVGAATMMMLVALITGVVIHKKIFKDFFTFRPDRSPGRSWLDAHNVSGVMALPFHLMITYTGLVTLMFTYIPAAAGFAYGGDRELFFREAFPRVEAPPASGRAAALVELAPLLAQARAHWGGGPVGTLTIHNPGDAAAAVDIVRRRGAGIVARMDPALRFSGTDGSVLLERERGGAAMVTFGAFYGLHVAWFAQPVLRALLFVLGIAGCLMIASGAVIWVVKRRARHAGVGAFGYRLVEALNVAGFAGMGFATAVYFWANRLVPVAAPDRFAVEIRCLFGAWLLALVHALLRCRRIDAAWREQLWSTAGLLLALPLLNVASGGFDLAHSLWSGRWALGGFDLTALAVGSVLAWAGWKLGRRPAQTLPVQRARRQRNAPIATEKAA